MTTVYNVTRGPVRVLGKVLPRHRTIEVDVGLLTPAELDGLRALEAYDTVRCTPTLLSKPVAPLAPKPEPNPVVVPKTPTVLTLVAEPEKEDILPEWWGKEEPKKVAPIPVKPARRKRSGS